MTNSWRDRKKQQLREQLYDAALGLFRRQGFAATTVEQITRQVEVGKGTFFNHFPAKEHLLREWYRRITFEALDEVRGTGFATARAAILGLLGALVRRVEEVPELYAMKERFAFAGRLLSEEEAELDEEIATYFVEQVTRGMENGELRADLDDEVFTSMIAVTLTGTAHEWVIAGHEFDLAEVLSARIDFLFRAAGA